MSLTTGDSARPLAGAKKRRGVACASITRPTNRLKDLEGEGEGEGTRTLELAKRMSQKLTDLDSEFRTHHHTVVDLIDDDDTLAMVRDDLHRMELDESDKLFELQNTLECQVFECSVKIKKLLLHHLLPRLKPRASGCQN